MMFHKIKPRLIFPVLCPLGSLSRRPGPPSQQQNELLRSEPKGRRQFNTVLQSDPPGRPRPRIDQSTPGLKPRYSGLDGVLDGRQCFTDPIQSRLLGCQKPVQKNIERQALDILIGPRTVSVRVDVIA